MLTADLFYTTSCCTECQLATMSNDEDTSPAMQFTRSVRRTGRKPLASPSDSENTPTVQPAVHSRRQQQSAACGYVRQQLEYDSPCSQDLKGKAAIIIGLFGKVRPHLLHCCKTITLLSTAQTYSTQSHVAADVA